MQLSVFFIKHTLYLINCKQHIIFKKTVSLVFGLIISMFYAINRVNYSRCKLFYTCHTLPACKFLQAND
ncbi:hypothetical protein CRENPOLYSF1_330017 [Crenothrix polyspora]|uniref:Uncharacterized protein n=1 Tax=Crenothrix polyspora TaxID=360316 RepID=A0A1R4H8X4_9GAMM|nr:hypothetical protein CRENPOLYSF1_330017 [Crenothrix polyspora]